VSRRVKFIAGGLVIAAALGYLVFTGVSRSVVYFVTPSELGAAPEPGKAYRLGGMVKPGTLKWNPKTVELDFVLSDGQGTIAVKHKGAPPDLFAEGRGAVVEGTWSRDGYFQAASIMAKRRRGWCSVPPATCRPSRPSARPWISARTSGPLA